MRIVHFADLHIGVESYSKIDPDTGLSTRLLDILKALDFVVDYAITNNIDLVLFCGDTYKSRDPSQTQQREFARRLKKLSEAQIPFFLLVGNHDLPNAVGRATAIEIFNTLAINQVYIGANFAIYRIATKSGDIQIIALPWLRRSVLLSKDDTKNLNMGQVNDKLQELMTQKLMSLIPEIDRSIPVILAAHASVTSAKMGSENTMLVGREPVLLLSNVAQTVFDYVALGHMHRNQVLSENPPVIYSGSLESLDFSDEGLEKGFYVVDIEQQQNNRNVRYEFKKINSRRFVTIPVKIKHDDADPTGTIISGITKEIDTIRDAVVKLQLSLPRNLESVIKDSEIYKTLKEAYYVTIAKEYSKSERPILGIDSIEQLNPSEAIKIYLESKKVPEEKLKKLLEYGEKVIKECSGSE